MPKLVVVCKPPISTRQTEVHLFAQLKIGAGSWNELSVEGGIKSGSGLGKGLGGCRPSTAKQDCANHGLKCEVIVYCRLMNTWNRAPRTLK